MPWVPASLGTTRDKTCAVAEVERRTIAVLVDNESGILARVVGLFSGRGCNIESLTVAEVDRKNRVADH